MLIYRENVLGMLKNRGYSTYRLRKDKIMSEAHIQTIRDNHVSLTVLDQLCKLLDCQPGDILEYVTTNEWLNTP